MQAVRRGVEKKKKSRNADYDIVNEGQRKALIGPEAAILDAQQTWGTNQLGGILGPFLGSFGAFLVARRRRNPLKALPTNPSPYPQRPQRRHTPVARLNSCWSHCIRREPVDC